MINCFAITEKDNLPALAVDLGIYPLTRLVGFYQTNPLKYADIMELDAQLVFVGQTLVANFKTLLSKLSHQVLIVYLLQDSKMAYQAFKNGALDFIAYPFGFDRVEKCINKLAKLSLLVTSPQPQKKQRVHKSFIINCKKTSAFDGISFWRVVKSSGFLWEVFTKKLFWTGGVPW